MATGPNFAPPLPLMQPPACRLLDPPNSPPIDPFLADRLRNHRHLAIAPGHGRFHRREIEAAGQTRRTAEAQNGSRHFRRRTAEIRAPHDPIRSLVFEVRLAFRAGVSYGVKTPYRSARQSSLLTARRSCSRLLAGAARASSFLVNS